MNQLRPEMSYYLCSRLYMHIIRAGRTAQRSRQLSRAAGILRRQIVSGRKKGEKEKGKVKKLRKVKKEKKERNKER